MSAATPLERAKRILLSPRTEWSIVADEVLSAPRLYLGHVVPLAAIPALASLVSGSIFDSAASDFDRARVGLGEGITEMVVGYALSLVGVFVTALIVDVLAPKFGGHSGRLPALRLVAYSFTAVWVAGIGQLLPVIGGAITLAGVIYSIYLLYLGLPVVMRCPEEKALGYTAATVVAAAAALLLIGQVAFHPGEKSGTDKQRTDVAESSELSGHRKPNYESLLRNAVASRPEDQPAAQPRATDKVNTGKPRQQAANFLEQTKFSTTETAKNTYSIRARLPNGDTASLSIKILGEGTYMPSVAHGSPAGATSRPRVQVLEFRKQATADGSRFVLKYVIPYEDVPSDLLQSIRANLTRRSPERVMRGLLPIGDVLAQEGSGVSGVGVVFEGIATGFMQEASGAIEQGIGQGLDIPGMKEGVGSAVIGAAGNVIDSLNIRNKHLRRKNQLRLLRICAAMPTNELTRKMYKDDPTSRDKILEELDGLDRELDQNGAVGFSSILAEAAAGLAGVPALSLAAAGASSWARNSLDELNEGLVEIAAKMIAPCGCETGQWYGSISYTSRLDKDTEEPHPNIKGVVIKNKRSTNRKVTFNVSGEVIDVRPLGHPASSESHLRASVAQTAYSSDISEVDHKWEAVCGKKGPVDKLHTRRVDTRDETGHGSGPAEVKVVLHFDGPYSIAATAAAMAVTLKMSNSIESESSEPGCVILPKPGRTEQTTTFESPLDAFAKGTTKPQNIRSLKGSHQSRSHIYGDEVTTWDLTCRS